MSKVTPWYDDPPGWVFFTIGAVSAISAGILAAVRDGTEVSFSSDSGWAERQRLHDASVILGLGSFPFLLTGIIVLSVTHSPRPIRVVESQALEFSPVLGGDFTGASARFNF